MYLTLSKQQNVDHLSSRTIRIDIFDRESTWHATILVKAPILILPIRYLQWSLIFGLTYIPTSPLLRIT